MSHEHSSPPTRQVFVLAAVCLAAVSLPLSFSGGAIAAPAIGRSLGGNPIAMNWITNAFMLTFGSLLMAAGALADRFGRKKVFVCGIAGFAITSLGLGFASSILEVDLLRGVQGIAAAAALAGGTASLAQEYHGSARAQAFSLLGTSFGIGLAFGPVLAGWLMSRFGWHAIFAMSTITGTLSLVVRAPLMHESRDPHAHQFDLLGTATFTAALSCFTCGIIEAPSQGWSSPIVDCLLGAFVVCAVAFVAVELHVKQPMLDLSLFRYPRFIGVQVLPIATCYCFIVLLVLLPLRFIGFGGQNAFQAGVTMLARSSPMLVVPLIAGLLTRWLSAGIVCGLGLLLAASGLCLLGRGVLRAESTTTLIAMLAIGIGAGLPWGLMDGLSVSAVPRERAGIATGIFSTIRVAGEGIALAIVTASLSSLIRDSLSHAVPRATQPILSAAAQHLAIGDVAGAATLIPTVMLSALRAVYQTSFTHFLDGLAVITFLCAAVAFAFLGRSQVQDAPERTSIDGVNGGVDVTTRESPDGNVLCQSSALGLEQQKHAVPPSPPPDDRLPI